MVQLRPRWARRLQAALVGAGCASVAAGVALVAGAGAALIAAGVLAAAYGLVLVDDGTSR